MEATIIFPGDYFSLTNPNDNFAEELDAVIATEGLHAVLFNYDEYIDGEPLRLSKKADILPKLIIYRGWMMKPEQYERFYDDLKALGFVPLTDPTCYERMHCFPNAYEIFEGQTPKMLAFPLEDGAVHIPATLVNNTFDRFMVKDYVKSAKNTSFPAFVETPVTQQELDELINEFIRIRGELLTGGIVLKEYVDLKRYDGRTNEWRMFSFANGQKLAFARNSLQSADCPKPPESYIDTRNFVICPLYTVDFAELDNGAWTVIEAGDGQVSGLPESDSPARFYKDLARRLSKMYWKNESEIAIKYADQQLISDSVDYSPNA